MTILTDAASRGVGEYVRAIGPVPLEQLLPRDVSWHHRHGTPGHGRDHVLPALVAPFASVPVLDGRMMLGTWQSICLVDTNVDNPRRQVRLSWLPG